ncbi:MAG: LuxR C-terminal-related transcriptional regulator [Bacteroidaceae bacterium]|nr:LuxR C-terminal-related transcriptional regulator [Bacteroidaceae bacterium]
MKKMKLYESRDQMITLIRDNYNVLQAMSAFGIKLGFGDKTVHEVCQAQNVDTYTFLMVVNYIINGYRHQGPDEHISVPTLLRYLRASHEYFLGFQLPSIRKELDEALAEDQSMRRLILRLYDEYARAVLQHMKYEERNLFPYVEALLRGHKPTDYSVETFSQHHSDTTAMLTELKNIILKYLPSNGMANHRLTATLYYLYNNEEWLQLHSNVEDEIFTPAIRALEESIESRTANSRLTDMLTQASDTADSLSDREREVIVCLVQGMTNKEIADRLCISIHTVTTHRRNIARKLQIHSPAGLTIYAIVNNLIDINNVAL